MDFPELREAGQALANVCDGAQSQDWQGFNGFDSPFAKDLLQRGSWSFRQASAMHKLLRKYKKQLLGFGMNYDTFPVPAEQAQAPAAFQASGSGQQVLVPHQSLASPRPALLAHQAPNISLSQHETYGLQFRVEFPFDAAVKDAFRVACKTTIWEPERKTWVVPSRFSSELLAFARTQNWQWSDDALFEAMKRERDLKDQVRAREEATKASTATDSDFLADWTSSKGHKLFPYQRAGAEYLVKKERCWLADSPGLGKTAQALGAIHATKGTPALIICPASAVMVWRRHVAEWLPGCAVTEGKEAPRAGSRSIHITSYDRASRDHARLVSIPWTTVVCDESRALKNRDALRTRRICGHEDYKDPSKSVPGLLQKAKYRYLLDGTPVPNRPAELIQPLIGLDRLRDLGGFKNFASRYCGWSPGVPGSIMGSRMENLPELNSRLKATCWVRRLKEDVMKDLPPKFTNHVPLALKNPGRYESAERDVFAFLDSDPNESEALVRLTTLRRVAAEEKMEAAQDWIRDFIDGDEAKIVVFGWHNSPLEALHQAFPGSVILTGSTSKADREKAVDRFQNDPKCKLFIGNLQAAGQSITLTAASDLAFFELPWKPGEVDQAADRIHRIGQTAESVTYHYLLAAGTIDEDLASIIDEKRAVVNAVQDGRATGSHEMISHLLREKKNSRDS